ncbi:MAG: hypothetical protein QOF48_3144 [Verrucomicrobiota bacterium]
MKKPSRKTAILVCVILGLVAIQMLLVGFVVSRITRHPGGRRGPAPQARNTRIYNGNVAPAVRTKAPPPKAAPRPKPTGPQAAAPQFLLPGGVYSNEVKVAFKAAAAGASVRYTTDGSEPTESSPAYTQPFSVTGTMVVRARTFDPKLAPSPGASATYTLLADDLTGFTSNLPLVIINSFGQYIGSDRHVPVSVRFVGRSGERAALGGTADFDGRGEIKRRGFSSLRLPKQSFTFKARDEEGDKVKFSPAGLPAESDWVLYAPYADKTLMRDVLAYELSNQMGRYAPRTRFVEVFVARPNSRLAYRDYMGVYVLVEKIKRSKERVNIAKLGTNDIAEPDISGGYVFKRDHGSMSGNRRGWGFSAQRASDDGVGFKTPRDLHLFFVDPKEDDLTVAQRNWLARYVSQFEDALNGNKFASPSEGYAKYLDVDAFIDHFWLVEMSKNIDGFRYSAYLHKPRNGKIVMGPAWDWNLSFGNADYYDAYEPQGWYYSLLRDSEISWHSRLSEDPAYVKRSNARWTDLRRETFAPDRVLRRVDEIAAELKEARVRNFRRWPVLGRYISPNYYAGATYEDEIAWMKKWIKNRIAWIDRQVPKK